MRRVSIAMRTCPRGSIRFMREQLRWDVFFVMEEDDLRRASDIEHFRMAAQLRRTLLTLDKDYLDDVRFPPAEGSGVLVLSAPHQEQFERLLKEVDRVLFRPSADKQTGHRRGAHAACSAASCTCTRTGKARWSRRESRYQRRQRARAGGAHGCERCGRRARGIHGSRRERRHRRCCARDARGREAARALRRSAISFPDPDSRNWPSDLAFLSAAVGEKVPVRTLSTGNASALAEIWYGSGKGARNLIAFSIGPCVSAGIISNGVLLSGAHGLASSVQWLALNPVEREDYRRMGCLEAESGAAGIVRRLVWRIKSGDQSRVLEAAGGDFNAITLDMILKGARDNDGVSISVIRDTVKYLAMAVSNIAAVIDPEVIVLGGILQSSGDLLLEPIRQECARRMPPGIYDNVRIEVSQLGADSAPIGAARFAEFGSALP